MRLAHGSQIVSNPEGQTVAVFFGNGGCYEHGEAEPLKALFGVDGTAIGIPKRKLNTVPLDFQWVEDEGYAGFCLNGGYSPRKPYFWKEGPDTFSAWGDDSFFICANNPKGIAQLREIYEAVLAGDAVIWTGHEDLPGLNYSVLASSGLMFAIASRLPAEFVQDWIQQDQIDLAINKEVAETGIVEKLAAAGKRYYALSPSRGSGGQLLFFLNPAEQDRNNYGWFGVKDLEAWIRGEGPIPKQR